MLEGRLRKRAICETTAWIPINLYHQKEGIRHENLLGKYN
jgi:hypothetical protein